MTKVIGLTGNIATGKSTAAQMLRILGVRVFDADKAVHRLMGNNRPVYEEVASAFPKAIIDERINRRSLGKIVFEDDQLRLKLEAILHPRVRQAEINFIKQAIRWRLPIVALDIPLLFETGAEIHCSEVWVTHCPDFLMRQRALKRPGMTEQKLQQILVRQMPQQEKLALADVTITSGLGKAVMMRKIIESLEGIADA